MPNADLASCLAGSDCHCSRSHCRSFKVGCQARRLLPADVVEIEDDGLSRTSDGPDEAGLDASQILRGLQVVEFDFEALPVLRQLHFVERPLCGVEVLFLGADQSEAE